jgi:hypothetical protein
METAPVTVVQRAAAASLAARCLAMSVCLGTLVSAANTSIRSVRPLGLVWDGGVPPLGHGWSRAGHVGAARPRTRLSRSVTSLPLGSRSSRRRPGGPDPYRSPCRSRIAHLRERRAIALWGTARLVRSSPSPLLRFAADETSPRPWGRVVDPKCPKARVGPPFLLLGSSCHAASGARIVPWRQPGDRAMKPSDRLHRASSAPIPTCWPVP